MTRLRAWGLPGMVAVVELLRLVALERTSEGRLVESIFDDAFYYLVPARHFAESGRWTFDGVAPDTGFHLLWGYLLAGIYWVAPGSSLRGVFLVAGLIQIACLTVAVWLVGRAALRLFGARGELGVAVVFLSALSLMNGLGLMEFAVVVLVGAAAVDRMLRTEALGTVAGAFGIGLVGMLARSDFGLLVVVLACMQWWMWRRGLAAKAMLRQAGAMLAGSVAGLGVVMLHTHWVSGGWVQTSAWRKFTWAREAGFSVGSVRELVVALFNFSKYMPGGRGTGIARWVAEAVVVGIVVGIVLLWQRLDGARRVMVVALGCVVVVYAVLYRFDSQSVQAWYTESFEVPLALLAAGAASYAMRRWRVATISLCVGLCACGVAFSFAPAYAWERDLYAAGIYLREHPDMQPTGAWDAGIVGYFAGGSVTNLDGLVNDEVRGYVESDGLARYVQTRGLRTIVDYRSMLRPEAGLAGGYSDGRLVGCLVEEKEFGLVVVYGVREGCLDGVK